MAQRTKKVLFSNRSIKPVFTDARGIISDILEEPVSHIGLVTFTKGAARGNHYHKKSVQYSYILKGKVRLDISSLDRKKKKKYMLKEGDLTTIPTQTIHTYTALTPALMLDITTYDQKKNRYEEDTYRIKSRS